MRDEETLLRYFASLVAALAVTALAVFVGIGAWAFAAGSAAALIPTGWTCCYLWGRRFNQLDNERTLKTSGPKPIPPVSELDSDLKH